MPLEVDVGHSSYRLQTKITAQGHTKGSEAKVVKLGFY